MIQPSDIHTLTEFKRDSSAVLERMESTRRPQILTVDGKARAILLDVKSFERMADLVDEAEALEGIRAGLADLAAGRTMSLEQAMVELKKRLARRRKGSKSA